MRAAHRRPIPDGLFVLPMNVTLDVARTDVNLRRIDEALAAAGSLPGPGDRCVVVLPERFWRGSDPEAYRKTVGDLAARLGCWVAGGSLHATVDAPSRRVENRGVVAAPDGHVAAEYSKRRPFAAEADIGVRPGSGPAVFEASGVRIAVCICADLFDPDALRSVTAPPAGAAVAAVAAVVVCACSTSRKRSPDFARSLWSHLAVTRAWELNAFVAIADWAAAPHLAGLSTCGVGGLADPTRDRPPLFDPAPTAAEWRRLDLGALERLERDRLERNFLWRP